MDALPRAVPKDDFYRLQDFRTFHWDDLGYRDRMRVQFLATMSLVRRFTCEGASEAATTLTELKEGPLLTVDRIIYPLETHDENGMPKHKENQHHAGTTTDETTES
jgi:hypothetical protein